MTAASDAIKAVMDKETFTADDHRELLASLFEENDAVNKFRSQVAALEAANPEPAGGAAVKLGIARYMLCRFTDALETLAKGTDNKDRRYFQALCYKALRQYDKAAEELDRAKDRGWDATEIDLEQAEIAALAGKIDVATKALEKLEKKAGQTAQYHYVRGLALELAGFRDEAAGEYVAARGIDSKHPSATFRLAYFYDLHGEEEQAVELYKECISRPPVHANALMNLAVIHEDAGRNEQAISCLRRVLSCEPNHLRARLFLKDAEAARSMYYDEEQARRIARRNAVLDIPVTDFELSVRARNCLKKMNIRTLGDLVRTTEAELLGYKNFGETSLKEIKDMMTAKGLRLGQALEEAEDFARPAEASAEPASISNEGVLATPIEQVEFSVRARRALESLKIRTLGELAAKSEPELLACRNFGQTSLNEIRQRLGEYGLQLREA